MNLKKLYFLTGNKTKLARIQRILSSYLDIENINIEVDEPQSNDQAYVAITKANEGFKIIKKPLFAQDCGFYISKYNSFPGVYTKSLVDGIGIKGLAKLIDEGDEGYYQTTFAYKDDDNEFCVSTKVYGTYSFKFFKDNVIKSRIFGNIFIPNNCNIPYAQLKDKDSDSLLKEHYIEFKDKILSI